ncbi:MAG: hypothetical protein KDB14_07885 [Planctomycetales bacterium]|nr:hypothetical protein [Planctomycetales bacterium]
MVPEPTAPSKPGKPAKPSAADAWSWSTRSGRLRWLGVAAVLAWIVVLLGGIREWRIVASQRDAMRSVPAAGASYTWTGRVQGVRLRDAGDAELAALAFISLPDLRVLQVTESRLSADGVQWLSRFPRLYELNLRGTPLPPETIELLLKMTELRRLDVTRCGLELQAIRRLETAQPELRIDS